MMAAACGVHRRVSHNQSKRPSSRNCAKIRNTVRKRDGLLIGTMVNTCRSVAAINGVGMHYALWGEKDCRLAGSDVGEGVLMALMTWPHHQACGSSCRRMRANSWLNT